MSGASFLDRSPEVSLASAFAIWIRWRLKRKLKRNPSQVLCRSASPPAAINFQPSDSCLGVKPCNLAARPFPNESPSKQCSPHRDASSSAESNIDTGPFHAAACPRASMEAEPRVVQALRRAKTICESWEKAPFHLYLSCPPNELHAQCHGRGRRLPSQTQP
jgi:hypothetical protein